jgi:hypothetical protein
MLHQLVLAICHVSSIDRKKIKESHLAAPEGPAPSPGYHPRSIMLEQPGAILSRDEFPYGDRRLAVIPLKGIRIPLKGMII